MSEFNYDYMAERLDAYDRDVLRMLKEPTQDIVNKLIDHIEALEVLVDDATRQFAEAVTE